ncbi:peptidylprolyl isomerase [Oscillatoria sp. CS-180]|uniref:peptidylprolyl isomerase n=1 Tax=Oscillatoria sp. CS-180 TaxID=3021720 RepID=UPI00232CAC2C|nr:peptidylprolyl isomerase [Oscillatoria sp. CS-180]MDB9527087.1 peptidylprolyl isomerase [Oscillatoria sp. CS-180]
MQLLNRWLTCLTLSFCLLTGFITTESALGSSTAGSVQAAPLPTPLVAYLPPGNAITDGRALLRYSLPIDNQDIRAVQEQLEGLSEWLRSKRWSPIKRDITKINRLLGRRRQAILEDIPEDRQALASEYLDDIRAGLEPMLAAADERDRESIWIKRAELLSKIGAIEEMMVTEFPYEVPEEYRDLPQLKGRATIAFETTKGDITAVIDGYTAPVTGGNFVDLVQRGFYDGMPFIRAEDNYVLQTGDPDGPEVGFVDPDTGEYRAVPLEILVKGDDAPIYGATLEELGRYLEDPVLPFSAYGVMGMARPESDVNGGSSQFFFFLFEPELTPAGLNLLDGRYTVFGSVVDGKEVLQNLGQGDRILSAEVVDGLENLVEPQMT